jgi:RNA polymerase sigma-70 factor (ECF subfamily)
MSTIAEQRIQYLQNQVSRFDDQLAYKELFITFYPSLFRFVLDIVGSREEAEEIISDLFMKIWEKRKTLGEILNLRVYCFVAARNLSINQIEKKKREATCDIDEYASGISSLQVDPEQLLITEEMLQRIHRAVDALPARCKLIFKLVKEDGFRYKEAAEILNISVKTVENQLAIALKKISATIRFDICRSIPFVAGH